MFLLKGDGIFRDAYGHLWNTYFELKKERQKDHQCTSNLHVGLDRQDLP